jgi:hypothetical protein
LYLVDKRPSKILASRLVTEAALTPELRSDAVVAFLNKAFCG